MTSEDLEQLHLKIAFLERAGAELSDVVYRQQQELDALRTQLASVCARLDAAQSEATRYSIEDERPPHY